MNCEWRNIYRRILLVSKILVVLFTVTTTVSATCWSLETSQILLGAQQGDSDSAYFLGVMYHTGTGGVSRDCDNALKWTHQAALQGHPLAQSHLGAIYRDGCDGKVLHDAFEAYFWTALAARQGLKFAKKSLGEIEEHLHPYLVSEAQDKVEKFIPVN